MSGNKKLDLSPLPDQSSDYSQYEETEVLWGRIFAVIVIPVLLISAGIYFWFSSNGAPNLDAASQASSRDSVKLVEENALANPTSVMKAPAAQIGDIETDQSLSSASPQQKTIVEESKPGAGRVEASVNQTVSEHSDNEGQTKAEKNSSTEGNKSIKENKQALTSLARELVEESKDRVLASVLVVNSGIKEAVLSLSIENDVPGAALPRKVVMNAEGIMKVILHTEMNDIRGKTLFHEWYRNNVRQARVRIPVNVSQQKSYSSKFINRQMLGSWHVKVVDSLGEPYVLADFEVVSEE